jgi:hypothetical protein
MNHRANSSVQRNQNEFIQRQAEACRKAGAVVFTIDPNRKNGMSPSEACQRLRLVGLEAEFSGMVVKASRKAKAA